MKLELRRLQQAPLNAPTATIGTLLVDGSFQGFTLEDIKRDTKVMGQTRIPAGTYKILQRKVVSGKTKQYQDKYPWFKWHLELQNVPNFENIYIHIGNSPKDTDGCILTAATASWNEPFIGSSTDTFKRIYLLVTEALESGEEVTIDVIDD